MTYISNIHDVEKIIGDMLCKQSALAKNRIMNLITPRGEGFAKFITDNVSLSYDLHDSVIFFEVTSSNNNEDTNFTEKEKDSDDVRIVKSYEVNIIIYGNESSTLANILKARFETEKVRYDLVNLGIYLANVSAATSVNEFINNTMWPRSDFSMTIDCEMQVSQIDTMQSIEESSISQVDSID